MRINENILISSLTTMRLGGPAKFVVEIEKPEEIPEAYNFARQNNLPIFILGYGANTIGHDEGFPGVIIINRIRGIVEDFPRTGDAAGGTPSARSTASTMGETAAGGRNVSSEGPKTWPSGPERPEEETFGQDPSQTITAMGGELWDDVVAYACERGLTGIEALSKIPGLAAAAPVQNIGAYGQEIADTLAEIDVFDSVTNTFKTLKKDDLGFSYRKSILNTTEKNRYFVISITLELHKGSMSRPFYNSIEKYITENNVTDFSPKGIREIVSKIRADKLPDPKYIPSAGSFFKNIYLTDEEADKAENKGYPVYRGKDGNKINSGWLIEQAGFKGKLLHGIRVNEKAALVLINESAKSYEDLSKARAEIVAKVYDKFGYWLEQEPMEIK